MVRKDGKLAEVFVPTKELSDDLNPEYMFNMTATEILLQIAKGKIDAVDYAKKQLSNRGIGKSGVWVGFSEAAKQWEVRK